MGGKDGRDYGREREKDYKYKGGKKGEWDEIEGMVEKLKKWGYESVRREEKKRLLDGSKG